MGVYCCVRLSTAVFIIFFFFFSYGYAEELAPAVFVFGDSLVDVGNNNHLKLSLAKADFPHNGLDFPGKHPTGRFSNGKNAADFLAEKLGLPSSPPYLSLMSKPNHTNASFVAGVNFASGGAGILDGNDGIFKQTLSLNKQLTYYAAVFEGLVKELGSGGAAEHLSKSIFAFVIGSNDILGYYGSKSNARHMTTPQVLVHSMATTLKQQLKRMYGLGARKFAMVGVGAVGCCPSQRKKNITEECNGEANYWAFKYNELLKSLLQELKSELNGMTYSLFDTYSLLHDLIQKPALYGFKEVKSACCGLGDLNADFPCLPIATYCSNRKDHVFWDLFHPTEATASIMIEKLFDGTREYTFPMNVRQLAAA